MSHEPNELPLAIDKLKLCLINFQLVSVKFKLEFIILGDTKLDNYFIFFYFNENRQLSLTILGNYEHDFGI